MKIDRGIIKLTIASNYEFSKEIAKAVNTEKDPTTFFDDLKENFNHVSLDDANRIAKEKYNPNNFFMVVVGNKDSTTSFLNNFDNIEYFNYKDKLE